MAKITLPLLLVEIDRGNDTIIPTKVPEHELPILKVVHGASSVRVVDEDIDEEIELDDGADSEFRRLQRKYRRINAPDLVRNAFPMGPDNLKPAGFKAGRGEAVEPAQSAVRKRPTQTKAKAKAEAAKAKGAEAEKAAVAAELDKLGVQYDGRSGVEKLRELLEAEKAKGAGK